MTFKVPVRSMGRLWLDHATIPGMNVKQFQNCFAKTRKKDGGTSRLAVLRRKPQQLQQQSPFRNHRGSRWSLEEDAYASAVIIPTTADNTNEPRSDSGNDLTDPCNDEADVVHI